MNMSLLLVIAVATYTAAAAITDWRARRIPNYLTVPAAILGLAYHALHPMGWGALTSLEGCAIGLALLIIPCLLGGSGMGDVKLLGALGAWIGPKLMLAAFGVSIVLAGGMAVAVIAYAGLSQGVIHARKQYKIGGGASAMAPMPVTKRVLPFAVPVAISTWGLLAWLIERYPA